MKSDHLCGISKCSVFVLNYDIFVLLLCLIQDFLYKRTIFTYIELLLFLIRNKYTIVIHINHRCSLLYSKVKKIRIFSNVAMLQVEYY